MKDGLSNIIRKYFIEWNPNRKLILSSTSIVGNDKNVANYFKDKFGLDLSFKVIKSNNFMSKGQLIKDLTINKYDSEDGNFDKRFKILLKLFTPSLMNRKRQTIISCSEANINLIKSQFNSKRIKYALIANCNFF
jgi:hypothetical protein